MPKTNSNINFDEFWERMHEVAKIKNQTELASLVEVGKAAVSWAKKHGIVPNSWVKILTSKGFNLNWIMTGAGNPYDRQVASPSEVAVSQMAIPRIAAHGVEDIDETKALDWLHFNRSWAFSMGKPEGFKAIEVLENSMMPEFKKGDLVTFDSGRNDFIPDAYFVIKIEGCLVPRKLIFGAAGIEVQTLSPEKTTPLGDAEIVGMVIHLGRTYEVPN